MSVLILADERDPSADTMVLALQDRGAEVYRLNTAWFPAQLSISARLRGDRWTGNLRTEHHIVELEEIEAIWYRSPKAYQFPASLNTAEREHANVEAKYGLGGVLMALPVLWVNHPARLADSGYKPYQLAVAARCGLRVADTLITNHPESVLRFAGEGTTVNKMLGAVSIVEGGLRRFAHTRAMDAADLSDLRGVEITAHQFQRWAPKAHEARMFVIGGHVTTAAIYSHTESAHVDWRTGYDTNTYELVTPPPEVAESVHHLMADLGLVYGALDFVIGPDDTWTFLEINAGGQYGWIEDETGAPLTSQLADLLMRGPQ
ncbi:ATP-grasp ribosomal peptide maturase [Amycolatopsis vastitatis]|uniref:RimK domain-containing protein n=1 Tax=Amycolatopsis vastitatis TaxID=1905142 RepID=A0A229TED2_9PSEU|nr:ATP-grasp ribosomal peptide maturase [Amycolatopsis vastitatis]OXM69615.1 RimK domain-containing protein [Amycolatopsis vastitatis]